MNLVKFRSLVEEAHKGAHDSAEALSDSCIQHLNKSIYHFAENDSSNVSPANDDAQNSSHKYQQADEAPKPLISVSISFKFVGNLCNMQIVRILSHGCQH